MIKTQFLQLTSSQSSLKIEEIRRTRNLSQKNSRLISHLWPPSLRLTKLKWLDSSTTFRRWTKRRIIVDNLNWRTRRQSKGSLKKRWNRSSRKLSETRLIRKKLDLQHNSIKVSNNWEERFHRLNSDWTNSLMTTSTRWFSRSWKNWNT